MLSGDNQILLDEKISTTEYNYVCELDFKPKIIRKY